MCGITARAFCGRPCGKTLRSTLIEEATALIAGRRSYMKVRAGLFASFVVLCLVILMAPSVMAQTAGTGAIAGVVTDSTGAVVPNVKVTATNTGTGQSRTTTAGGAGDYSIQLLPPGVYSVKFEVAGFETLTVPSVTVTVTETGTLNQTLTVGAQTQEITVQANVETVQT